MNKPIIIEYVTDVLCVWAWVSQQRIERLEEKFGDQIHLQFRYLDVFGDTQQKMQNQWADRGHYQGFAEHVRNSASCEPNAVINPKIWHEVQPTTSTNAHLILKAIELAYHADKSKEIAAIIRKAFYVKACDISQLSVLMQLVSEHGLDSTLVQNFLENGQAIAALMTDYQSAKQQSLKGSPTYIIDNGRQVLFGNISDKVLHANINAHLN
ncbi:DsbA family protein [Colwellia sp. 1_MG-2023]|uniref:DsbA family oxidoreductase n=1 Tax=Colwellia sp. 1_MG-2023 TaxID=3062649 RepID=UPI0026E3CEC7|nr:DsbA family protein [Colwellia sp. 1_MG-2023]MDO6444457.1 DsbA family protein [Colwellia sp. 1_MG-2023]